MQDFILALPLGLDSFALCIGLGALGGSWSKWLWAALIFGFADAVGTAVGLDIAGNSFVRWPALPFVAPVAIAIYGAFVLFSTVDIRRWAGSPLSLLVLAFAMSLDNVVAAALDDDAKSSILSSFVATSIMALVGCILGAALARRWPSLRRILPGGAALTAALIMGIA